MAGRFVNSRIVVFPEKVITGHLPTHFFFPMRLEVFMCLAKSGHVSDQACIHGMPMPNFGRRKSKFTGMTGMWICVNFPMGLKYESLQLSRDIWNNDARLLSAYGESKGDIFICVDTRLDTTTALGQFAAKAMLGCVQDLVRGRGAWNFKTALKSPSKMGGANLWYIAETIFQVKPNFEKDRSGDTGELQRKVRTWDASIHGRCDSPLRTVLWHCQQAGLSFGTLVEKQQGGRIITRVLEQVEMLQYEREEFDVHGMPLPNFEEAMLDNPSDGSVSGATELSYALPGGMDSFASSMTGESAPDPADSMAEWYVSQQPTAKEGDWEIPNLDELRDSFRTKKFTGGAGVAADRGSTMYVRLDDGSTMGSEMSMAGVTDAMSVLTDGPAPSSVGTGDVAASSAGTAVSMRTDGPVLGESVGSSISQRSVFSTSAGARLPTGAASSVGPSDSVSTLEDSVPYVSRSDRTTAAATIRGSMVAARQACQVFMQLVEQRVKTINKQLEPGALDIPQMTTIHGLGNLNVMLRVMYAVVQTLPAESLTAVDGDKELNLLLFARAALGGDNAMLVILFDEGSTLPGSEASRTREAFFAYALALFNVAAFDRAWMMNTGRGSLLVAAESVDGQMNAEDYACAAELGSARKAQDRFATEAMFRRSLWRATEESRRLERQKTAELTEQATANAAKSEMLEAQLAEVQKQLEFLKLQQEQSRKKAEEERLLTDVTVTSRARTGSAGDIGQREGATQLHLAHARLDRDVAKAEEASAGPAAPSTVTNDEDANEVEKRRIIAHSQEVSKNRKRWETYRDEPTIEDALTKLRAVMTYGSVGSPEEPEFPSVRDRVQDTTWAMSLDILWRYLGDVLIEDPASMDPNILFGAALAHLGFYVHDMDMLDGAEKDTDALTRGLLSIGLTSDGLTINSLPPAMRWLARVVFVRIAGTGHVVYRKSEEDIPEKFKWRKGLYSAHLALYEAVDVLRTSDQISRERFTPTGAMSGLGMMGMRKPSPKAAIKRRSGVKRAMGSRLSTVEEGVGGEVIAGKGTSTQVQESKVSPILGRQCSSEDAALEFTRIMWDKLPQCHLKELLSTALELWTADRLTMREEAMVRVAGVSVGRLRATAAVRMLPSPVTHLDFHPGTTFPFRRVLVSGDGWTVREEVLLQELEDNVDKTMWSCLACGNWNRNQVRGYVCGRVFVDQRCRMNNEDFDPHEDIPGRRFTVIKCHGTVVDIEDGFDNAIRDERVRQSHYPLVGEDPAGTDVETLSVMLREEIGLGHLWMCYRCRSFRSIAVTECCCHDTDHDDYRPSREKPSDRQEEPRERGDLRPTWATARYTAVCFAKDKDYLKTLPKTTWNCSQCGTCCLQSSQDMTGAFKMSQCTGHVITACYATERASLLYNKLLWRCPCVANLGNGPPLVDSSQRCTAVMAIYDDGCLQCGHEAPDFVHQWRKDMGIAGGMATDAVKPETLVAIHQMEVITGFAVTGYELTAGGQLIKERPLVRATNAPYFGRWRCHAFACQGDEDDGPKRAVGWHRFTVRVCPSIMGSSGQRLALEDQMRATRPKSLENAQAMLALVAATGQQANTRTRRFPLSYAFHLVAASWFKYCRELTVFRWPGWGSELAKSSTLVGHRLPLVQIPQLAGIDYETYAIVAEEPYQKLALGILETSEYCYPCFEMAIGYWIHCLRAPNGTPSLFLYCTICGSSDASSRATVDFPNPMTGYPIQGITCRTSGPEMRKPHCDTLMHILRVIEGDPVDIMVGACVWVVQWFRPSTLMGNLPVLFDSWSDMDKRSCDFTMWWERVHNSFDPKYGTRGLLPGVLYEYGWCWPTTNVFLTIFNVIFKMLAQARDRQGSVLRIAESVRGRFQYGSRNVNPASDDLHLEDLSKADVLVAVQALADLVTTRTGAGLGQHQDGLFQYTLADRFAYACNREGEPQDVDIKRRVAAAWTALRHIPIRTGDCPAWAIQYGYDEAKVRRIAPPPGLA